MIHSINIIERERDEDDNDNLIASIFNELQCDSISCSHRCGVSGYELNNELIALRNPNIEY